VRKPHDRAIGIGQFVVLMKAQAIDKKSAEIKAFLIAQGSVDIDESVLGRITTPASGRAQG